MQVQAMQTHVGLVDIDDLSTALTRQQHCLGLL